jgi:hypothetical protein
LHIWRIEQEKTRFISKNVEKVQGGLAGFAYEGGNRGEGALPERR